MSRGARAQLVVVALSLAVALATAGCKKKAAPRPRPPDLAGLSAVPADVTAVVGFDVARLGDSPLILRMARLLVERDPDLAAGWQRVASACQLDLRTQLRSIVLALRPRGASGAQPVLSVATGALSESTLATCLRSTVGSGGADLSAETIEGRTVYQLRSGGRVVWLSFVQAETVALSSDPEFLHAAIGAGPKLADAPPAWMARASAASPVWAVGVPDARIGLGLVRLTKGALSGGPAAIALALDPSAGIDATLDVVMVSDQDAKQLETLANQQLPILSMGAQLRGVGPLVAKLTVSRDQAVVRLRWTLSIAEINQLMSAIDTPAAGDEDATPLPPPPGTIPDGGVAPAGGAPSAPDAGLGG